MMRMTPALVLGLLFLAASPPPLAGTEAKFLIETINVTETKRVPSRIILSESLLREGQGYSEGELRDALARVKRLPFVLDADFSLGRGSQRGAYNLSITVVPVSSFFMNASSDLTSYSEQATTDSRTAMPRTQRARHVSLEPSASIGRRWFLGSHGVLFAGLGGGNYADAEIGYTQYDALGTKGFASASLRYARSGDALVFPFLADPSSTGWEFENSVGARLTLGLPVGRNHSVRARLIHVQGDVSETRNAFVGRTATSYENSGRLSLQQGDLFWSYDTTNDAVFPTQGTFVAAGPGVFFSDTPPPFPLPLQRSPSQTAIPFNKRQETVSIYTALSATRYIELSPRHSLSVGLGGSIGASEVNAGGFHARWNGFLSARHAASLWSEQMTSKYGDLRLETGAEYSANHASTDQILFYETLETLRLRTGLVYRNGWALLRLGFSYTVYARNR